MPVSAFLAASAAARIASLNLCTDEYLLLLAEPRQIASVSYLSRDPRESPLWRSARRHPGNRGSLEDVLPQKPTLVLTMGGGGRATALLAKRLHIRSLDLPFTTSLAGVEQNLRTVAAAIGSPSRADTYVNRIKQLRLAAPARVRDTIWISGNGETLAQDSLGARWLRLAGLRQRGLPGSRASLETLLTRPPQVLVQSDYRSGQMSGGARWLSHPIVRQAATQRIVTDGRPWTCLGPLMIGEIERLRRLSR
jgi:iron complex transport system substrate-binding protein